MKRLCIAQRRRVVPDGKLGVLRQKPSKIVGRLVVGWFSDYNYNDKATGEYDVASHCSSHQNPTLPTVAAGVGIEWSN